MKKQLPKNWVECSLGEIAEWGSGGTPNRGIPSYYNGTIPWLKTGDLNDGLIIEVKEYITELGLKNSSAKIFPKNSVVIAMYGATIGKTGILNFASSTNQACAVAVPYFNMNKFIYLFLKSEKENFIEKGKGGAQPNISQAVIKSHRINLPPLPEQNRIVEKLDKIFAQLETIKASMTNIPLLLKDFRQQVLAQAVTGKLTGCKVEIKRLGDLLTDVKYGTSMKSEYGIDGTPIFRIPNINDGEINDTDLKYSILEDKEYNQLKLVAGDVLIIRSNGSVSLVGRSAIIRKKHEDFAYAGYLIRLRCGEELKPDFLNYTLKSSFLREQIVKTSHSSSGVNNINSQEIKDLKIYWTSPKKQQEIVSRVESLFAKADAIDQQYKSLKQMIDTLPQALLHKAFKGELTEQMDSDGDARELLKQIQELKGAISKASKNTKLVQLKEFNRKLKGGYKVIDEKLGMVAEPK